MSIYYLKEPLNVEKHILKSPFRKHSTIRRKRRVDTQARHQTMINPWYYGAGISSHDEIKFVSVRCKEHNCHELIPVGNFRTDLRVWYYAGVHPRFSVRKALTEVGFRPMELWEFMYSPRNMDLIKRCKTEREFKKQAARVAPSWIYVRDRGRVRVSPEFREKFVNKRFTPRDFFDEPNQDRRRLMLRRGIVIEDLLEKLTMVISSSSEGSIYHDSRANTNYLYVKCPSTGDPYLLTVPRNMGPAEARRWTFDLPRNARFVVEA